MTGWRSNASCLSVRLMWGAFGAGETFLRASNIFPTQVGYEAMKTPLFDPP